MFDQFIHRWLRVPYRLHTTVHIKGKPRLTVMMLHGIGNSERVWDKVLEKLPDDIRVVTIDLLGFGQSPRPEWAEYNARTQARSVFATYVQLAFYGQVVVVGHSLGALVAIELARHHPLLVKALILCGPPLYYLDDDERKLLPKPEKVLTSIYKVLRDHPEEFVKFGELAVRYKLITNAFQVNSDTVDVYMATLESAIINQTSMDDIVKLRCPIQLLHGRFDPVVVSQNLSLLEKTQPNIKLRHVASGHEITGPMVGATADAIAVWLH